MAVYTIFFTLSKDWAMEDVNVTVYCNKLITYILVKKDTWKIGEINFKILSSEVKIN